MARLLTSKEAAQLLNLGPQRIRQLANAGLLPIAAITSTGTRLFDPDHVEMLRMRREAKASK